MGVGVVGLAENKANSAQLELEAGAELGKNRGLGTKNQKSTLNISKLEYYKAFWVKIQKLKILGKNLKKIGGWGPKTKK